MDDKRCIGVDRLLNVVKHQKHYILENKHSTVISKERYVAVYVEKHSIPIKKRRKKEE